MEPVTPNQTSQLLVDIPPTERGSTEEILTVASRKLEMARSLEAEYEALGYFASSLIKNYREEQVDVSQMPPGIQDAWRVLSETTATTQLLPAENDSNDKPLPVGQGQFGRTVQSQVLAKSLKRSAELFSQIQTEKLVEGNLLKQALSLAKRAPNADLFMKIFDQRMERIRAYSVRQESQQKRRRVGQTLSDGYDLASLTQAAIRPILDESLFSTQEVMGKYLDLMPIFEKHSNNLPFLRQSNSTNTNFAYYDFLEMLSKGLNKLSEAPKLEARKFYLRFLHEMETYMEGFVQRTNPLLDIQEVVLQPAQDAFDQQWASSGGCQGWEKKPSEAAFSKLATVKAIDLSSIESADDLEKAFDGDRIKAELSRLGLKCGGTVAERAKRLFMTKDTPLENLPPKLFAKGRKPNDHGGNGESHTVASDRRVDLARLECIVSALLNYVRPSLDATIRRAERRQTQTLREREKELEEELHGSMITSRITTGDASDDEDEVPIYNPKNVPL